VDPCNTTNRKYRLRYFH